ncbi:terpenoid synthase [Hypoxylon sp. FL1150]|nr:terpenoid synthase [Hypoxylon sp. FL1150]
MGQLQSSLNFRYPYWGLLRLEQSSGDEDEELRRFLRPLISSFIADAGYRGPCNTKNEAFWTAVYRSAVETGVPHAEDSISYRCLMLGGQYAIACFPTHPLDVQVYIAIYTWLAILVDDSTSQDLPDIERFHQRLSNGEPQPTRLLESFALVLRSAFNHWDPIAASSIISASINFFNACALELRPEIKNMAPTKGGLNLPWYLRQKSGIGDAYAYFAFPKVMYPNISCFIEAVPEIAMFVCLANDILSFYKEEQVGETTSYVHTTARYTGNDARGVLKDIVSQAKNAVARMRIIVKGKEPYEQALNNYIVGYIDFHMQGDRYKLREIGLGGTGEIA